MNKKEDAWTYLFSKRVFYVSVSVRLKFEEYTSYDGNFREVPTEVPPGPKTFQSGIDVKHDLFSPGRFHPSTPCRPPSVSGKERLSE